MSTKLIEESPLLVLPTLAVAIGFNEAVFLQQLKFILQYKAVEKDDYRWHFKTYKEWEEVFPFWSNAKIRRIIGNLENMGVLISTDKYNRMKADNTKWYRIDENQLSKMMDDHLLKMSNQDLLKMSKGIAQNEQTNTVLRTDSKKDNKKDSFSSEKPQEKPSSEKVSGKGKKVNEVISEIEEEEIETFDDLLTEFSEKKVSKLQLGIFWRKVMRIADPDASLIPSPNGVQKKMLEQVAMKLDGGNVWLYIGDAVMNWKKFVGYCLDHAGEFGSQPQYPDTKYLSKHADMMVKFSDSLRLKPKIKKKSKEAVVISEPKGLLG